MAHSSLLAKFLNLHPQFMTDIRGSQQIGNRKIRIDTISGKVYHFEYYNDDEWTLTAMRPDRRVV